MTLPTGSTISVGGGGATDTFDNTDTVNITGGSLSVDNFNQTSGSTTLATGTLAASSQIQLTGGILAGNGTVTGNVDNSGTVDPATNAALQVSGNYTQEASGSLDITLAGSSSGQYGQITVTGTATLAGTLAIREHGGYVPPHGQKFPVVTYGSESGTFSTLQGSPTYTVTYGAAAAKAVFS